MLEDNVQIITSTESNQYKGFQNLMKQKKLEKYFCYCGKSGKTKDGSSCLVKLFWVKIKIHELIILQNI